VRVAAKLVKCLDVNIIKKIKALVDFAKICVFSVILAVLPSFAANISRNCSEEIIALSKGNGFDMQEFAKNLIPAVAKAKLQAKAPFGKPKDSDKTDIGMSFGCLKSFPESLGEIQSLLKDVVLETAKNTVVNKPSEKNENGANLVDSNRISKNYVPKSSGPILKECDAIFNPNKKFCYDGGIYDLCDGMSYNPTTHICTGDIAYRALCNGEQYNPLKQKCENNVLLAVCGKIVYNPKTQGCKDDTIFEASKCGTIIYDPKTHYCKDNVLFARCGEILYNPVMFACKDNTVLGRCGRTLYDPKTQGCKDNVILAKCGKALYDSSIYGCKDNEVLARCGATEFYNPKTQECRYGSVFEK